MTTESSRHHTPGTRSFHHGLVDRSSANHDAVTEPTSFFLLKIRHSGSGQREERRAMAEASPWKWTPASGWLRARCSSAGQVFLSHLAAGESLTDTLHASQLQLNWVEYLVTLTANNWHPPRVKRILYHSRLACVWLRR
jgi:hypothetical protein